jgi:hypothetical protein
VTGTTAASPLDTVPDPEEIRDRLAEIHGEARLLRRLLRLAVDADRERAAERPASKRRRVAETEVAD